MAGLITTVLMTVYNGAKYLEQSIQSIVSQTYQDFEFLIIDNASQDNSVEIIQSFNDPRIRLVRNETNLGQTAALNLGIQLSKGEWIARMDADDVSLPTRLESQHYFIRQQRRPIGVVGTQIAFIDQDGKKIYAPHMPTDEGELLWKLIYTSPLAHSSVLMNKDVIIKMGGYNPEHHFSQDLLLWLLVKQGGYLVTNIESEPKVLIRLHSLSFTSQGGEALAQEVAKYSQQALKRLFGWDIGLADSRNLAQLLRGGDVEDGVVLQTLDLAQNCYAEISKNHEISRCWDRTLTKVAFLGKNHSFLMRLNIFKRVSLKFFRMCGSDLAQTIRRVYFNKVHRIL